MFKHKILFRYILKELISPFGLGLLIFTFILLMNKILKLMDLVINAGIGLGEVVTLIAYLLPSLLVLTVPMSILLAILIALGKLSGDSEVIAMKASGISMYQMLPPFAALCVAGFLFTNLLTLYVLPRGNHAFKNGVIELAKKHSEASLQEGLFNDTFEDLVIYINRVDKKEKRIDGILVSDRRDPAIPTVIVAEHAVIVSGQQHSNMLFRLFNGSLHRLDRDSKAYHYAVFNTYEMNIQLDDNNEERRLKNRELGMGELVRRARLRRQLDKSTVRINVEIHRRLAFPVGCLVFGLLGIPLGVCWRRGGRSYGFILSICIVFVYYVLLSVGENLAKSGYLFAFMGIWLPNVLLGGLGVYLFRKIAREQPVPLAKQAGRYLDAAIEGIGSCLRSRKGTHKRGPG